MRLLVPLVYCALGIVSCSSEAVVDGAEWQIAFELADGDYLLPRLSPDGSRLAYVEVVVVDDRESSQLWVMDLTTEARTLLVDGREVARHGYYRASAVALEWVESRALTVSIHDGDMDILALTVDAESGDPMGSTLVAGPVPEPTPAQTEAAERMLELFPEFGGPSQVQSVFWLPHVFLSPDSVLIHRDRGEAGFQLWLADLREGTLSVADSSWSKEGLFAGGIALNARLAILFRTTEVAVDLLRYSDGAVEELSTFPGTRFVDARELRRSASGVIFLLRNHHPSETGTNQLLVFDGEAVRPLLEREGLVDADLVTTETGGLVAASVWRGGTRMLEVHRSGSRKPLQLRIPVPAPGAARPPG